MRDSPHGTVGRRWIGVGGPRGPWRHDPRNPSPPVRDADGWERSRERDVTRPGVTHRSGCFAARRATRCNRTNRLATKRTGSYLVVGFALCQGRCGASWPRMRDVRTCATSSRTKPAYGVGSHYLLGVDSTRNPLASEISIMRGARPRSGGMLGFRKWGGFARRSAAANGAGQWVAGAGWQWPCAVSAGRPTLSRNPQASGKDCRKIMPARRPERLLAGPSSARANPSRRGGAHRSRWPRKRAARMAALAMVGRRSGYLPDAALAVFFLSSKSIFSTFLKAAMSRMSSPRSFISTRIASCSWASSWESPSARWPG